MVNIFSAKPPVSKWTSLMHYAHNAVSQIVFQQEAHV